MTEQFSSKELLPCPFCGEKPRLTERPATAGDGGGFVAIVSCFCGDYSACAHKLRMAESADDAREFVTLAWNKRDVDEGPPATVYEEAIAEQDRMQHDIARLLGVDAETDSDDLHERIYTELSRRASQPPRVGPLKLDTDTQVFFYEQDHYYLSNFSAFRVKLLVDDGQGGEIHCTFDTSEAAYHWFKFPHLPELQAHIRAAQSAHAAFKLAEQYRERKRPDWDAIKADVMREVLRAKVRQHEYVRRKLLETGDRELIENSWRDDVWGWGPNRDGQNLLGKLWMEVRAELRASAPTKEGE
jgi:ribA/ribD-fused uncharacterized protein